MLAEWLVAAAASPDFCAVNIRPATICGYSPRQRFDLTVNKLTADAIRKRLITVHGGEQSRPNVGMADVVNLYGILTETHPALINGRTFNFGFENHKVIEIAHIIQAELADLNVAIKITDTLDQRDYHISSKRFSASSATSRSIPSGPKWPICAKSWKAGSLPALTPRSTTT